MKVLIVEDDQTVACALKHLLSSYHHAVDVAVDGEVGLQMVGAHRYDLILLDVVLPRLDGISVCRQIRAQGQQVPVLLLTGQGEKHCRVNAPNAGADGCIVKPFDAQDLMVQVQSLLHRDGTDGAASRESSSTTTHRPVSPHALPTPIDDPLQAALRELHRTKTELAQQRACLQHTQESLERERQIHQSMLQDIRDRRQLEEERQQAEEQLQQQWQRERLIAEVTRSIRQTLDLDQILQSAVYQVRQLLQTDRVIIFGLHSDSHGVVAAESVGDGWLAILDTTIRDHCFNTNYANLYRQGRVAAIEDIYAADVKSCYLDLLQTFQVRANLVVPILQEDKLWGLLIAHHCSSPRQWESGHIQLLTQVAEQIGIAIRQAELYQQARRELLERRQTQTALEDSEERFRSLTAFAPVGIYQTDTEGHCIYTNACWQKIAGLTLEESLGEGWVQGIHPDDCSTVFAAWSRFVHEHQDFALEFRFLTPQGEERWVYGLAKPIYSATGDIVGYVGVNEDITDRKRTDAALRESEARFRNMTDAAPIMVWMSDIDNRCTYFNQPWLTFTGQPLEQEVGEGWTKHIHPDDYDACLDTYATFFDARQSFEMEYRLRRCDGEYRWLLDTGTPRYDTDGTFLGYIGSCIDISDRKRAEQKIREQAALIDIATDAIFVRDLDDRIVFWSRGAEILYGWTADEAIGQTAHELFGRDSRSTIEAVLDTVTQQEVWQGELSQTTKSGCHILVESRWTRMPTIAGQPQLLLVVNTDITEKKQLEAQFHQAQRLESLGRLASGIAHDLNNVLTPILAIAQLLQLPHQHLDEQTKSHLELVERSAKRGANMVKQILTFARGSYEDATPVDLLPLLNDVVDMARSSFPESIEICRGFGASDNLAPPLDRVLADATQLHQVLMNLCVNARDAMPDGGVLTISAEAVVVDQAIARLNSDVAVGSYIKVTIADTGMGITAEVRDRMFEPFFTTKGIGQGTGLGLATT
ncbi:MAG: PAS domain S-box protein, partial [Elainellaceae cyanobacterium]